MTEAQGLKKEDNKIKEYDDGWEGYLFGATGARISSFLGGKLDSFSIAYLTIGPKYNFSSNGWSFFRTKGFSLSLPIGIGVLGMLEKNNNATSFALPIALETNYMFSDAVGFGLSAGVRYTYSPQERGDLHMMDFYAEMDICNGFYIEAGYVFIAHKILSLGKIQFLQTL